MIVNNDKITAPISISDPYKVMGVAPGGWYDLGTICANGHGKINKWSIRKPMDVANILRPLTDAEIKAHNCGLGVFSESSVRAAAQRVKDGCDWTYDAPKGGIASPFRLSDFNGYDHAALPWCQLTVDVDTKQMVRFAGMENGVATVREWIGSLSGLFQENNTYACVLLFRLNSGGDVWSSGLYVMGELRDDFDWEKQCNVLHELMEQQMGSGDLFVVPAIAVMSVAPQVLPFLVNDNGLNGAVTIYPLPSQRVTVRVKSVEEQKLYPKDLGIVLEYVGGSVTITEAPSDALPPILIRGSFSVRVWNEGTSSQRVTFECFTEQSLSAGSQIDGGLADRLLNAGDSSGLLTFDFEFRREAIKDDVESIPIYYRLAVAGCDGVERDKFDIETK